MTWHRAGHERRGRHWSLKLPLILAVVQVAGTRAAHDDTLSDLAYGLLIAGPLALAFRRLPTVALAGALLPTAVYFGLGLPDGPGFVAAIVALFAAAKHGWVVHRLAVVALSYGVFAYLGLSGAGLSDVFAGGAEVSWKRVAAVGIWTLVALGFSEAARVRTEHFAQLRRARAEQERAEQEQERARQEQQRRQASEERLRIAQELHDVLGHHLSLINVQAGVGLHLMDARPEQARAALAAIKQASAEALRDTRAVLAALHPPDGGAPRTPTPGLADLDRLVAEVTAAGLPVTVTGAGAGGTDGPLPPEVDRAAYRIVQEALTNVRRHAGDAVTATVDISRRDDMLFIFVTDDGKGSTVDDPDGNGIAGMRQRALALGGEVTAGPGERGGFQVMATLPCRPGHPASA